MHFARAICLCLFCFAQLACAAGPYANDTTNTNASDASISTTSTPILITQAAQLVTSANLSGITSSPFNASSSPANASVDPFLETLLVDNRTVIDCPILTYDPCCSYYNSALDTKLFSSWLTSGDIAAYPTSAVGAKYNCCGRCYIRAEGIQVYFWPSAADLVTCTSQYISVNTWYNITHSRVTYSMAGPAIGCNDTTSYTPYTMVISGNTLTSPTPYISISVYGVFNWCGLISGAGGKFILSPSELMSESC
jgi:hypothetical protein